MLSKEASSTIFESSVYLDLGLNPGLPGHWLTSYPQAQYPRFWIEPTYFSSSELYPLISPVLNWTHLFPQFWVLPICLKQNFIAYRSSKVSSRPDCIFEIHQLWQSGFSRVYSNCCCSCSFEPEIMKIHQSSHKMYRNNILSFQEYTTILNACTIKRLESYWGSTYIPSSEFYPLIYPVLNWPPLIFPVLSCTRLISRFWVEHNYFPGS